VTKRDALSVSLKILGLVMGSGALWVAVSVVMVLGGRALGETVGKSQTDEIRDAYFASRQASMHVSNGDGVIEWVLTPFAAATVRAHAEKDEQYFFVWLDVERGAVVKVESKRGPGTIESTTTDPGQFVVFVAPLSVFERGYRDVRRAMRPADPFVESVETLKNMAHYFEARENWPVAIAEYEKIVVGYPREAEGVSGSYVSIAMCYMKMGEYAKALEACERLRNAYKGVKEEKVTGLPLDHWRVGAYHEAKVTIFKHHSDWRAALEETRKQLEWLKRPETMAALDGEVRASVERTRDEVLPERIRELQAKLGETDDQSLQSERR
jgi:tetratricopeptide (TPR) repeat protein